MNGFGETVTVVHPNIDTDRYGNEITTWDHPTEVEIPGAAFDPGDVSEDHDHRSAVVATPAVYLPSGTDVRFTDRIRARGVEYDSVGDATDWVNPYTAARPGIVINLRRVNG